MTDSNRSQPGVGSHLNAVPDRTPTDDAVLALLLEVAGTPKPGNVDRTHDLDDLQFESFLGGAVGARAGLDRAAAGAPVGESFEHAVAGMADRAGTNTQFGCLLLLVPLIKASVAGDCSRTGVDHVTRATTVDDAVAFYTAFEHVDVAVRDPPADADELDVRRGSAAEPALRERTLTLRDVLALGAGSDGDAAESTTTTNADHNGSADECDRIPDRNAQEWIQGFPRTFRAAAWIRQDEGPVTDRAARAFIALLAREPDTLVATAHDPETARVASRRARDLTDEEALNGGLDDPQTPLTKHIDLEAAADLGDAFVAEGINPGTTADLTCAALYVALRRGLEVRQ